MGKYAENVLACEPLRLPATREDVQALLQRIGVDGIRYEETFITDYDSDVPSLCKYLGEYENIDELNHLAHLIVGLSPAEREMLEAALGMGEHTESAKELINLVHNLDCYMLCPGVEDEGDLGRYYAEELDALEVPEHLRDFIDYEAYGRSISMSTDGCFVRGGYVMDCGGFKEVYEGREDIPAEHRIFSFPKLNIREQMAAYQEVSDKAAARRGKPAPEPGREER